MGTTTTDTHGGDGRGTPGLVQAEAGREVGAARDVETGGEVRAGPEVRVGLEDGVGGRLPRLERWTEGRGVVAAMAVGLFVGAGWGIVARAWMRLIAEHPEFSWSGTLYIVGAPAVIGSVVALAHVAMARQWRAAMLLRVPAVMVHVLLGMGAGALLLPTIVFGSVALVRRRFGLVMRIALGLLVLGLLVMPVGIPRGAGDGSSSMAVALLAAGVVVAVLVVSGWRTRVVLGTLAVVVAVLVVSGTILATDIPLVRALLGSLFYLPLVGIPALTAGSVLRPREAAPVVASRVLIESLSGEVA